MKKERRIFGKILMTLMVAFFYLPIIYMVVFSFNESKSLTSFTGFSLRWYKHMLESSDMMTALYTTFSVAVLATLISTVVGTIAAIGLSSSRKVLRNIMEQVDNLPMMNPEIVTAIGFMLLFITFQVEKGYVTMLLAHIAFCIPYVILSVMPKIRALDPNLADAAMDLGATPWKALTKVIVPQITPGIVSGALIAFTMSVCPADHAGHRLGSADRVYHVRGRFYHFLFRDRAGGKESEYCCLYDEQEGQPEH